MSGPNMTGRAGLLFSLITAALFCGVVAQTVRGRYLNAACRAVSLKPEFRYRIIQVLMCFCTFHVIAFKDKLLTIRGTVLLPD